MDWVFCGICKCIKEMVVVCEMFIFVFGRIVIVVEVVMVMGVVKEVVVEVFGDVVCIVMMIEDFFVCDVIVDVFLFEELVFVGEWCEVFEQVVFVFLECMCCIVQVVYFDECLVKEIVEELGVIYLVVLQQ